jgi:hypothetical protein
MANETNDGRAKCGASIVGDISLADNRLDHLLTSVASTLLLASIFDHMVHGSVTHIARGRLKENRKM